MKEKKAADMKRRSTLVILASLVALLIVISGCVAAGAQTKEPSIYSSEIYQ